jgi:hypothetical protein
MKSIAVKEEEKRIRKFFDYWHFEDKENGVIFCDFPYSDILTDKQIQLVLDRHLTRRYKRKYKWVKNK